METIIGYVIDNASSPNTAFGLLILLFVIDKYGNRFVDLVVKTFPGMASSHFKARAKDRDDRREFDQNKEKAVLIDKLAESELARSIQLRREEESLKREGQYLEILKGVVGANHALILHKIDSITPPVLEELQNVRRAVDRLAARYDGTRESTQNKILERIG